MRFSICVCTYNRAQILESCLQSWTALRVPAGCDAEILVIDNNSSDNTKQVVDDASRRSPIPMFYFRELEPGVSAARNRAIAESRGDYLGFLDDECVAQPDWLEIIVADIKEFSPPIIGGPYIGALLSKTPANWFKASYGDAYFLAAGFQRGYQKEFRASAGNMALHRRVCETQQFDRNLGPRFNDMKFGEETFLQERFLGAHPGTMVFYEPRIEVAHFILPHKMTLFYHAMRQMELGACHYKPTSAALLIEVPRALVFLSLAPFAAALRDRNKYPFWQNYAFERVIPRVMPTIGAALEKVRRRYQ